MRRKRKKKERKAERTEVDALSQVGISIRVRISGTAMVLVKNEH